MDKALSRTLLRFWSSWFRLDLKHSESTQCPVPVRGHSAKPALRPHNDPIREELVPSIQKEEGSEVLQSQDSSLLYSKFQSVVGPACLPTVLFTQRAEVGRAFEPKSSRSAWPTQ